MKKRLLLRCVSVGGSLYVCLLTNRMHRRRAVWPRPRGNKEKGRLYLTHLNNSGDGDDIQLSLSVYKQFVVFFYKRKAVCNSGWEIYTSPPLRPQPLNSQLRTNGHGQKGITCCAQGRQPGSHGGIKTCAFLIFIITFFKMIIISSTFRFLLIL